MKFELNDYHRNVSDQQFLQDVQRVAKILGKKYLSGAEYSLHGKYYHGTIRKRFGSWKKVLELCNLETKKQNYFRYVFSDEDIIKDLRKVAYILNKKTPTNKEYSAHGKYHAHTLINRYGSWNKVLKLAGMELNFNRNFSNEEMFEEIERVWILLGRQPTTTDIKNGISKFSLQSYARRFGGWRKALEAFINFVNSDTTLLEGCVPEDNKNPIPSVTVEPVQKFVSRSLRQKTKKSAPTKTPRDVNLRLRFKVLQRDNFKCCACGASPAKDSSVELHIDHIIPWSQGGETLLENLQTLCSKCNLGKSDIIIT